MARLVPYAEAMKTASAAELIKGDDPGQKIVQKAERKHQEAKMEKQRAEMEKRRDEFMSRPSPNPQYIRDQLREGQEQLRRGGDFVRGELKRMPRQMEPLSKMSEARVAAAASAGRKMAHAQANVELAKLAGEIWAKHADSDQEFEKVASLMVQTGMLSEEDYLLEKEAGWTGLRKLFTGARGALSGVRKRVGGWFKRRGKTPGFDRGKASTGWSSGRSAPAELGGAKRSAPAPKPKPKSAPTGGGTTPAPKQKPWKFPMGKALLGAGALGTVYAGSKLIPAAARAMESTSTTPMAHGLGWSPVSYGYGHTPYGPGMATMGGGA